MPYWLRKFIKSMLSPLRLGLIKLKIWILSGLRAIEPVRKALRIPRNKMAANVERSTLTDETTITCKLPHRISSPQPTNFFQENSHYVADARTLLRLKNARVWTKYAGSIFTEAGELVREFSPNVWGKNHAAYAQAIFPKPTKLPGRTLCIITPEGFKNYGHWICEHLTRFSIVDGLGYQINDFDQILMKAKGLGYHDESLKLLGIDMAKVRFVGENEHYECEELVVPSFRRAPDEFHPDDIQYLRDKFLPLCPKIPSMPKVYISRDDASFRFLRPQNELEVVLEKHQFQKVILTQHSLLEQIAIFAQADAIFSVNGSQLMNVVFCKDGAQLVEAFAPDWTVSWDWRPADFIGMTYSAMMGEGKPTPPGQQPRGIRDDIILKPEVLDGFLSELGL